MHITKRLFLAAAMAAGFVGSVQAADLDLNGVDRTVTDVAELADYDGVKNSSDTLATLTFNVATDMAYAGAISGNIRLVKEGTGMLDLSGSNTYTGGTEINQGRLMASSLTAFGAATGAIQVNSDCQQDPMTMTSNKVTCVVFNAAGTFAYPINTSAWTNPSEGPLGSAGQRQYNVAVTVFGVTLSGKITGGGLSVHFGGLDWAASADFPSGYADFPSGTVGLTISGDIDCGEGTCHFGSRAMAINVTGKVTALGIYQHSGNANWPPIWTLGNTGNSIGVIDVGGGASSDRSLTASAADALGGATVYSRAGDLTKSFSVKIAADQTVESISMNPAGSYAGGSLASSDGRHYISAKAAATVTMIGTNNCTNDWCLKDGGASKAMSLVWNPTGDYTYTCVGHENTIHGTITVSGGTFEVGDSCSFPNVTAISVANGATLKVSSAEVPFGSTVTIEAESGATLDLAGDMTAETVKVGDHYLSAKDFSAGNYKGLTITGAGKLYVTTKPGGEDTYTWVGGGADDNLTTAANWQGGQMPDFGDESPFVVFASGAAAVVNTNATFSGATFACAGDFALSASGDCVLALGEGGISNAPAASARAITVSASVMPLVDQIWQMETNTTFTLSGILKQYGTSTPTLTFRQSSIADPVITFIGAETAEGAGDFAGDIVFEETALPDGEYGTAHVRAVGFEPFGPDGTLNVKSQGAGHNYSARPARLTLANAVVSKAVEYGEYYMMEVYAEDNTTNVMNGAFTPFKLGATNGTFPPEFHVGTNAVLRLCGDMDFGTRNNNSRAVVSLDSATENVADSPTGTIAFDGRITQLPLSLKLDSPIRLEFNAADNAITNLNLRHGQNATAVVSFGTDYALSNGQAKVTFPNYQSPMVDFDLNGTTQHIAGFAARTSGVAPKTSRISSSGAPGVLRVSQASDVSFEGYVATNATIQMEGDATLTFTHETAFKAGSALVVSNGTVAVSSATALNRNVNLSLLGGAISIPSGQTAVVGSASYLDANGAVKALPVGVYGPGDASVGAYFAAGSGSIRVTNGRDPCTVLTFR